MWGSFFFFSRSFVRGDKVDSEHNGGRITTVIESS